MHLCRTLDLVLDGEHPRLLRRSRTCSKWFSLLLFHLVVRVRSNKCAQSVAPIASGHAWPRYNIANCSCDDMLLSTYQRTSHLKAREPQSNSLCRATAFQLLGVSPSAGLPRAGGPLRGSIRHEISPPALSVRQFVMLRLCGRGLCRRIGRRRINSTEQPGEGR